MPVPFVESPLLPRGLQDFWAFVVSCSSTFSFGRREVIWGFVH